MHLHFLHDIDNLQQGCITSWIAPLYISSQFLPLNAWKISACRTRRPMWAQASPQTRRRFSSSNYGFWSPLMATAAQVMALPKLPIPTFQEKVERLVWRYEEMPLYQKSQSTFVLGSYNYTFSSALREPSTVHTRGYPTGSISQSSIRREPSLFEHVAAPQISPAKRKCRNCLWEDGCEKRTCPNPSVSL